MATNRDYTANFKHNVKISLEAENIAKELLEQLTLDTFFSVRDEPEFFHIGDLLDSSGKGYDVKDDGVIHKTGNVFCETKKHWKKGGTTDGWMLNGEYDYLCVLDRVGKHIYVLDFKKLKRIYKHYGRYVHNIDMGDNYTDGFLISLDKCRKYKAMECESAYAFNEDCYEIVI